MEHYAILLDEPYPCTNPYPCIDPIFGPTASFPPYWSGTPHWVCPSCVWFVSFGLGLVDYSFDGSMGYYVRAVRGGS